MSHHNKAEIQKLKKRKKSLDKQLNEIRSRLFILETSKASDVAKQMSDGRERNLRWFTDIYPKMKLGLSFERACFVLDIDYRKYALKHKFQWWVCKHCDRSEERNKVLAALNE